MLASLAAALLALASAAGKAPPAPAFVVVIDPGHGGPQDGAVAPDGVTCEKDLTLEIARRVAAALKKQGGRVILTRTGDIEVPLANRAAIANAIRADLFVSIHLNSMPTAEARERTSGVETYFLSADASDGHANAVAARENADRIAGEPEPDPADPVGAILDDLEDAESLSGSSRLAYAVHERLVATLGTEDRGVKQAPFYVLAGARMPAVLLEVGFISHQADAARLRTPEYQEQIAGAIADGVKAFRVEGRRASK
ncbi:MAG: N-acetylmuramoyl-L-alanine amidase [Anaeromyxobacter sp.]